MFLFCFWLFINSQKIIIVFLMWFLFIYHFCCCWQFKHTTKLFQNLHFLCLGGETFWFQSTAKTWKSGVFWMPTICFALCQSDLSIYLPEDKIKCKAFHLLLLFIEHNKYCWNALPFKTGQYERAWNKKAQAILTIVKYCSPIWYFQKLNLILNTFNTSKSTMSI